MTQAAFPDAFARALERRGVSLAWLHQRLVERGTPVSPATLSYWRSGTRQPERGASLDALAEIENLLDVASGSLTSLLGPSRRPGPRPGERSARELLADTPGIRPALVELGFDGLFDELTEHLRHVTLDVDAEGGARGFGIRAAMQARHDGARRTPLFLTLDNTGHLPTYVPMAGCLLGRTSLDKESGVYAVELLLDHALAKDEIGIYELRMEFPEPVTDTSFQHFAARRMAELLVWVRFDPARLPRRVERYVQTDDGEHVEEVTLGGGTGVHALGRGFGPGMLGVRWEW
jgi:hypothetical protein